MIVTRLKAWMVGLPKALTGIAGRIRRIFLELEGRVNNLPRRRLALLVVAVSLICLLLGAGLGVLIGSLSPVSVSSTTDLDTSSGTIPQERISQTGVLRRLADYEGEIEFYLERADKSRVYLKATEQINAPLLSSFVGMAVTVEGTMGKSVDGSKDVLLIEKIVFKR